MSIHVTTSKTELGHDLAKQALAALDEAYPGYGWFVACDGGVIDIKCGAIGKASMVRHIKDTDHSAKAFKRDIVRSAGELLERAHLRTGKSEGVNARVLEGGEKIKWRPRPTIIWS